MLFHSIQDGHGALGNHILHLELTGGVQEISADEAEREVNLYRELTSTIRRDDSLLAGLLSKLSACVSALDRIHTFLYSTLLPSWLPANLT